MPGPTAAVFRTLLQQPVEPVEKLQQAIDEYLDAVRVRAQHLEFVDVRSAEALAHVARRLLGELWPAMSGEHRMLTCAAVRYFILEQDGEDDVASPIGFDDDVEVMNAVLRQIGQEDLALGGP